MTSYQYRKSHCGDKTILRPSYLHNGISYTGKMTSLYWIRALHISQDILYGTIDRNRYAHVFMSVKNQHAQRNSYFSVENAPILTSTKKISIKIDVFFLLYPTPLLLKLWRKFNFCVSARAAMAIPNAAQQSRPRVRALYSHDAHGENQLGFVEGDIIALIGEQREGWHYGENLSTHRWATAV